MSGFDGLKSVSDYEHLWRKKRKRQARPRRDPSALPCLNCDRLLSREHRHPYIFCSEFCRQFARHIRYVRGCQRDGRIHQELVQKAIAIERGHILVGGYSKRPIPKKRQDEIFARDKGKCVKCGHSDTEIDHIRSSSNALDNLQLLCHPCHLEKSLAGRGSIADLDPAARVVAWDRGAELNERIDAKKPLRPCDDDVNWKEQQPTIARERSAAALAAVKLKKA